MKTGLVIMASGLGKRYGGNKLMAPVMGKPLIGWILDASEEIFDKRIVVTRSKEVKSLCDALKMECILHDLPGRNDTVRLGLRALQDSVDFCFFAPGDQPLVQKDTLHKLATAAREKSGIIRTAFGDTVGAPVGFSKAYFEELANLPEGKGGSWIAKKYPDEVRTVAVGQACELWDIDTPEDMERVKNLLEKKPELVL